MRWSVKGSRQNLIVRKATLGKDYVRQFYHLFVIADWVAQLSSYLEPEHRE